MASSPTGAPATGSSPRDGVGHVEDGVVVQPAPTRPPRLSWEVGVAVAFTAISGLLFGYDLCIVTGTWSACRSPLPAWHR